MGEGDERSGRKPPGLSPVGLMRPAAKASAQSWSVSWRPRRGLRSPLSWTAEREEEAERER